MVKEDSLVVFLSMEKQHDLESYLDETPKQATNKQLVSPKEEAGGDVSSNPMFWSCVTATLLLLLVVSGAYQFCPSSHLRNHSVGHPLVLVDLLPMYEVPRRTHDSVLDWVLDEPRFSDRVNHADEFQGEAILHNGRAYLTSQHSSDEKGVIARPHSVGRLLHSQVLRMKHRGSESDQDSAASFQVTFVFSIENSLAGRGATGDGFAFVIVPEGDVMGSAGGSLGVMDLDKETRHTFAVEFDTWTNPSLHDISNNHVGVNVNSMVSVVAEEAGYWVPNDDERPETEFRPLDLTSGKIQAWIDFDSVSQELTVRISPILGKKPHKPLLKTNLDLSKIFNQYMSVGFSAATGDFAAKHIIHGWQFEERSTLQHWRSHNNVYQEQASVLPLASEASRKPQQFVQTRGLGRDVSNLPVFRNPHSRRYRDTPGRSTAAAAATVFPASVERPVSVTAKHCLAAFKEHLFLNLLWILLGFTSAVLFLHLVVIAYRILVGYYDTCMDPRDEAAGTVYQRVLNESNEEPDVSARYVVLVGGRENQQSSKSEEARPLGRGRSFFSFPFVFRSH